MTNRSVSTANLKTISSRVKSQPDRPDPRAGAQKPASTSTTRAPSVNHPVTTRPRSPQTLGTPGPRGKPPGAVQGSLPATRGDLKDPSPPDDWQPLPAPLAKVARQAIVLLESHVDRLFEQSMTGIFTAERAAVLSQEVGRLDDTVESMLTLFRHRCADVKGDFRVAERLLATRLLAVKEMARADFELLTFRKVVVQRDQAVSKAVAGIYESRDLGQLALLEDQCHASLAEHEQRKIRVKTLVSERPQQANKAYRQMLAAETGLTEAITMTNLATIHRCADWIAVRDASDELDRLGSGPLAAHELDAALQRHRASMATSNRNVDRLKSHLKDSVEKTVAAAGRHAHHARQRNLSKAWINKELTESSVEKLSMSAKMLAALADAHAPSLASQTREFQRLLDLFERDLLRVVDPGTEAQLDPPVALDVHRHAHRVMVDLRDDFQTLSVDLMEAAQGTGHEADFREVTQSMADCIAFALCAQEENISGKEKSLGHEPGADVKREARGVIEQHFKTLMRGAFEPVWTDHEMDAALGRSPQKTPKSPPKASPASPVKAREVASAWVQEASRFNAAFAEEKTKLTRDIARNAHAMSGVARTAVKRPLKELPSNGWFAKQFGTATAGLKAHLEALQKDRARIRDLILDGSTWDPLDADSRGALDRLKAALHAIDGDIGTVRQELKALEDERSLLMSARHARLFLEDTKKRIEVVGGLIDSGIVKVGQLSSGRYEVDISKDFGEQFELKISLDRELRSAMGYAPEEEDDSPDRFAYLHHFHFKTEQSETPTGSSIKPALQQYDVGLAVDRSSTYFPDVMLKEYEKLRGAVEGQRLAP